MRYVTTGAARGTLVLRRGASRTTVSVSARGGRGVATLGLPRRGGRYALTLTLDDGGAPVTDRASVIVR